MPAENSTRETQRPETRGRVYMVLDKYRQTDRFLTQCHSDVFECQAERDIYKNRKFTGRVEDEDICADADT